MNSENSESNVGSLIASRLGVGGTTIKYTWGTTSRFGIRTRCYNYCYIKLFRHDNSIKDIIFSNFLKICAEEFRYEVWCYL